MPIDYRPGYSRYLEGLAEPFQIRRDLMEQRRKDAEYKRQNDLAERRLASQEKQAQQDRRIRIADRNRQVFKELSDLVRSGRMSEAEAYAATAQYQDPDSGEMRGIQFNRGGEKRFDPSNAPRMELTPPSVAPDYKGYFERMPLGQTGALQIEKDFDRAMNPEEIRDPEKLLKPGDRADPKDRGFITNERGEYIPNPYNNSMPWNRDDRPPRLQVNQDLLSQAALPGMSNYMRESKPSITTPDGRSVEFDPEEGKRYKQQQAEETAARLEAQAASEVDPAMRMAALRAAERIRASIPGAETAQLQRIESQRLGQDFQAGENEKNRQNRIDVAKLRPRGTGQGLKTQKLQIDIDKKNLDLEQEYMTAAETTLAKVGAIDVFKQERKLQDMATQIAGSADNAALAAMVAGTFTKYAQGGAGVISDSDMRVFWQRMGGAGVRTMQAIEDIMSGRLHPEKKAIVEQAINDLIKAGRQHEREIGQRLETNVGAMPGGRERLPRVLGTYTPGYLKEYQQRAAGGGDRSALDAVEAEVDARLRKRGASGR